MLGLVAMMIAAPAMKATVFESSDDFAIRVAPGAYSTIIDVSREHITLEPLI